MLNPVLEVLELPWSPGVHHFGKQLDYALYQDRSHFERAQQLINDGRELDALRLSCAVAEAERWGKEFGQKPKRSDLSDPIFQIEFYLGNARRSEGPGWGILSNGHTWRLYSSDSDPLRHDFLEVELPHSPLFEEQETLRRGGNVFLYLFLQFLARRRLDRSDAGIGRVGHESTARFGLNAICEMRDQAFEFHGVRL